MVVRSMLVVLVFSLGGDVFLTTQGQSQDRPVLQAAMNVRLDGDVSASGGMIPLKVTFVNLTDAEATITNADYQFFLLKKDGDQIHDSLTVTTELRDIILRNNSGIDSPGVFLAEGKTNSGEEYYLVVTVHNLSSSLKFKAVE